MADNKVKFNIHNVHYAVKTADGTYDTPVAMPGAVSISLAQQGQLTPFYADGVKYYVSASNGGYEGDLVMALITDEFRKAILGEAEDTNKVLFENANKLPVDFALGFDVDGDKGITKFWFYNCTATRPSVEAQTNEDSVTPQTDTLTISCSAGEDGIIRAKTTGTTEEAVLSGWYTKVYAKDQQAAAKVSTAASK